MRHISSRRRAENEPFAPDVRPDAASFVYCVGCGKQLGQRSGLLRVRGAAINIYCSDCEGRDAEAWGESAPITFCFRCGTKHIRYIEVEPYRTIHSICPRCRPERAARYSAGDFAPLQPPEEPEVAEGTVAVEGAPSAVAAGLVEAPTATVEASAGRVEVSAEAAVEAPTVPEPEPAPAAVEAEAPAPKKRGRKPAASSEAG